MLNIYEQVVQNAVFLYFFLKDMLTVDICEHWSRIFLL